MMQLGVLFIFDFFSSMISSSFAVCTFLLSAIAWVFSVSVKHQNSQLPANLLQMHLRVMKRSFYCAMLCIRGTSHGPVSVRPSVRHKSEFY